MIDNTNRKVNKKLIIIVSCLLAAVIACGGAIMAYLADADKAANSITIGSNKIQVVEDFQPPSKLEAGVSFTKDVKVANTGTGATYVRVMAVFSDSDMGNYCTIDWNKTDWSYNEEDGYWYYIKALAKDETTNSLFTTVTLSEDIPGAAVKDFDIIIYAESYQAHGFSSYEAAWEHYQSNKPE